MNPEAIWAGWLVDGRGGPVRENVLLRVNNGTIIDIRGAPPEETLHGQVADLSHCTLLPGLIDAHIHLFMSGTEDLTIRERQQDLTFGDIKTGIEERLGRLIENGIVACRDGGDRHAFTTMYKKDHLNLNASPVQLKVAGAALHRSGRYGKLIGKAFQESEGLGQSICKVVRFIDHIKIINSGLNSLVCFGKETSPQFNVAELTEAVATGKRFGRKTMVHANGKKPVEIALKAGCHSIEHGFFMGVENLKRMAERQICWVPTAVTMKAYRDIFEQRGNTPGRRTRSDDVSPINTHTMVQVAAKNLDHQLEQMRHAKELGVTIALGTDAGSIGVHHGSSVAEELRLLMTAGFSVAGAVQCATMNGARLLDLDDYGVIAKGRAATFIAVAGPPRDLPESLARIVALYIRGERLPKSA
jgi:imidazolonepropionase-like amidohydrolase